MCSYKPVLIQRDKRKFQTGNCSVNMHQPFVHDPLTTISNEETFLQDFLENLEEMFPRYHMHSNICKRLKSVFKRVIYVLMSIRISSCKATRLPILNTLFYIYSSIEY